jgi:hypothetical protein
LKSELLQVDKHHSLTLPTLIWFGGDDCLLLIFASFAEAQIAKTRFCCLAGMESKVNSGAKLRGKMAAKGGGRGGDEGRSDDVIMLFVHVKRGRGRGEMFGGYLTS